jgi:L-alanine-DL-glutamate epimerase-like enolase superfamily enzyme
MLKVPDGAGLGVSLDANAVERYTGKRFNQTGGAP